MSKKLNQARAEIEAILQAHDIAGHVVLHEPGNAEMFLDISPSYSIISGQPPLLLVCSRLADYGGDVEAQRKDQAATANMAMMFAELLTHAARMFTELQHDLDATLGAQHGESEFTPDVRH